MGRAATQKIQTPADWIESFFLVNDPRDPVTGETLPPGPMLLAPHQRRIINEALSKDEKGNFKYTTIVYSAPKKSGKSAITSAVMLYMAHHNANAYIACVANDGKQSADRLYAPIVTNCRLHRQSGGIFKNVEPHLTDVTLQNFTKIEAIPCDAAGEAGSQPLASFFSELWAFTSENKRRVFTELSVPPTLYGRAIRWIETYAGFSGESELLEQLYDVGYTRGEPHPDFLDLVGENGPVVKTNAAAKMFVYWDTEARMVWQTPDFYQSESLIYPPAEFERVHHNRWVSPLNSFIEESWWANCHDETLASLKDGDRTPVVVGIDMSVSRDCAALVAVSRDPFHPDIKIAVRGVRIFSPNRNGGIIDQEMLIRPVMEDWAKRWNVICWVYDPHEMAKLAQDMVRAGMGWFRPFGQQTPRSIADKQLHDMILHREIAWNHRTTEGDIGTKGSPGENLYKHITQAGAKTDKDSYRLEKLANSVHIDGAVALSQAAFIAMSLSITNLENDQESLIKQLQYHKISVEEFTRRMRELHPQRETLYGN